MINIYIHIIIIGSLFGISCTSIRNRIFLFLYIENVLCYIVPHVLPEAISENRSETQLFSLEHLIQKAAAGDSSVQVRLV